MEGVVTEAVIIRASNPRPENPPSSDNHHSLERKRGAGKAADGGALGNHAAIELCERREFVRRHAIVDDGLRSEEHTSELQSLMRISYAVFCLKKKTTK